MDNRKEFKITAVFEDVPANASQQFDFVSNWHDLLESVGWLKSWIYRGPFTYVQLEPGTNLAATEAKIKDFLTPFLTPDNNGEGYRTELGLQAYNDMHLYSSFENGVPKGGRIEYVRLFGVVAIIILLIACVNFMNLATARSVKRAKEVGIRKTVGAIRFSLISQFIGEAMLLTFFALVVALTITASLLPSFNLLTSKHLILPLTSIPFWGSLVALLFVTGLVAGSYPAFFLSSLNSVKILKGSLKLNSSILLFRKTLVVFQFALSIMMITGAIVVSQQVYFIQSKNLGFDKENLLYLPFQGDLINKYEVFKQQLLNRPGIQNVTRSTNAPSHINTHEYDLEWEGKSQDEKVIAIHNGIGYDFLSMMNIPILQGRNFSKDFISDSTAFIINETALKVIGYKDPIGKPLKFFQREGKIVGVVKDFHLKSLHEPIKPLILFLGENVSWGCVLIKTQPGQTQQAIASISDVFKQLEPEFLLRYYFADEEYQKLYRGEQTISKLTDSFSIIAIIISCLGLLGLTIFTVEQRRKEIGVRKVIGASIVNIVRLLLRDIVKLVMLSSLIATPIAWFVLSRWLSDFAYRVNVSGWLFLLTALATLGVALVTISYHTIKAAMTNPVKSLKSE
jgi:ABC-type antimicrobial peptide transport system permease subunit